MLCDLVKKSAILHCVESYLYYIILVNKQNIFRVLTRFSELFRSEWKLIIYFPTLYVYCIYRVMSKAPKQLSNCLKRAESHVVLIVFDGVLCEVRAYKLISLSGVTVSYRRSTWIRYQKTISWSVNKYS
jgi:hypothetical protein